MAAPVMVMLSVFGHCHKCGLSHRLWTCRLASGDNEGRVVVWDVTTATAMATLEDPGAAAAAAGPNPKKMEPGRGGPVRDLAWVTSNPCLVAAVLANGMLLVWDQAGEGKAMAGQDNVMGPPGSHHGTGAAKKLSPRPGYCTHPLLHCSSMHPAATALHPD